MLGWWILHKMRISAKNFLWDSLGLLHISILNLFTAYVAPSILTCSTLPYAPAPSCLPVGSAVLTSSFNSGSSFHLWAMNEIDYGHIIAWQNTFGKSKIQGLNSVAMVMTILSHHAGRLYLWFFFVAMAIINNTSDLRCVQYMSQWCGHVYDYMLRHNGLL